MHYTGRDLDEIAGKMGFNRRTVKRNVEKWSKTDPRFAELNYIGQRSIPITLEDRAIVNQHLKESITQGIEVSDTYNLADARATLSHMFTYTGLKTFGGIDRDRIALRLEDAQRWFQQTYPNGDPFEWFPSIRSR